MDCRAGLNNGEVVVGVELLGQLRRVTRILLKNK